MDTLTASRYKKATRYVATVKSWRFATVLSFEFLNPKPTIERKPLETRSASIRHRLGHQQRTSTQSTDTNPSQISSGTCRRLHQRTRHRNFSQRNPNLWRKTKYRRTSRDDSQYAQADSRSLIKSFFMRHRLHFRPRSEHSESQVSRDRARDVSVLTRSSQPSDFRPFINGVLGLDCGASKSKITRKANPSDRYAPNNQRDAEEKKNESAKAFISTSRHERAAHETRFRLTSHRSDLPWLQSKIQREDRKAEEQPETHLPRVWKRYHYQGGRAETRNPIRRESPGRPREKSAQYRKVNLTLHLSVRYRTSELLWDRSCGLRRLNTGAIRRGAEHVWSQQSQILSTRFWYAGLSPFRYGRRLNLANFSHRRGSA